MPKRTLPRSPRITDASGKNVVPKPRVLFTHNDLDGVVSAIIFKKCYPNGHVFFTNYKAGFDCQQIDDAINEIVPDLPQDINVLIADISPSETVAEYLNQRGHVGLLDHHKTAMPLSKYPWAQIVPKKCGAMLVYELLSSRYHLQDYYPLVKHTDIYDRWQSKNEAFPHAVKLSRLLGLMGRDKFFERFLMNPSIELNGYEEFLLECDDYQAQRYIARSAQIAEVMFDKDGNMFARVVADRYISELGHTLLEINPQLDYILMVDLREGVCHLRGHGKLDLGALAKEFGGGGHPDAAGFSITPEALADLVNIPPEVAEKIRARLGDANGKTGEGTSEEHVSEEIPNEQVTGTDESSDEEGTERREDTGSEHQDRESNDK